MNARGGWLFLSLEPTASSQQGWTCGSASGTPPAELPAAVELTLPQPDGTVLRMVTLVGSGPAAEEGE